MVAFVPNKEQPLILFFELTVGGLNNISIKPHLNIPMDFSFTHKGAGFGEMKMTLFDQTGFQVEQQLWGASGGAGQFQFGYQGETQLKSPIWNFASLRYSSVWRDNSF